MRRSLPHIQPLIQCVILCIHDAVHHECECAGVHTCEAVSVRIAPASVTYYSPCHSITCIVAQVAIGCNTVSSAVCSIIVSVAGQGDTHVDVCIRSVPNVLSLLL